jgi:hypothetical protein
MASGGRLLLLCDKRVSKTNGVHSVRLQYCGVLFQSVWYLHLEQLWLLVWQQGLGDKNTLYFNDLKIILVETSWLF